MPAGYGTALCHVYFVHDVLAMHSFDVHGMLNKNSNCLGTVPIRLSISHSLPYIYISTSIVVSAGLSAVHIYAVRYPSMIFYQSHKRMCLCRDLCCTNMFPYVSTYIWWKRHKIKKKCPGVI